VRAEILSIGTELLLVRRAIHLDHAVINATLIHRIESDKFASGTGTMRGL